MPVINAAAPETVPDLVNNILNTSSRLPSDNITPVTSQPSAGSRSGVVNTSAASDSISDNVATEFTCFPKLPIELRFKIYKHSYENRIAEVRFARHYNSRKHDFVGRPPPLLSVCRESRQEGLKDYKFLFKTKHTIAQTYFNPRIDTLYLRTPHWSEHDITSFIQNLPDKHLIRSIASAPFLITGLRYGNGLPPVLSLPTLEEVILVYPVSSGYDLMEYDHDCNSHHGSQEAFPNQTQFGEPPESIGSSWSSMKFVGEVARLLEDVKGQRWGHIDWKVPKFLPKLACHQEIDSEKFHCPIHGRNQHSTRARATREVRAFR